MAAADSSGFNQGSYSFEQQSFCMSWATVLSFNLKGDAAEIAEQTKVQLLKVLEDEEIQELVGVWDLVWGPAVYADSYTGKKESLNAMFIVVPREHPQQAVIAISGTNGTSLMDWMVEDFNVGEKIPWPYGDAPSSGHISKGTSFGLDKLVKFTSTGRKTSNAVTARDFLAGESFTNIMVTGHSLGGALSPCYSLYLEETRKEWDPSGEATIRCLPTAGATPGDRAFSEYYDGKLADTTTRVWNSMDIVPRAFNKETLVKVPDLYQPHLSSNVITKLADWVEKKTVDQDYVNISPETEGFPSQYYDVAEIAGQYESHVKEIEKMAEVFRKALRAFGTNLVDAAAFIVQALIQHTIGYIVHFDIGDFAQRMTAVSKEDDAVASGLSAADRQEGPRPWKSKPILLDLGEKTEVQIDELKTGDGPLMDAIVKRVEKLNKGESSEDAQTLVFLVEEEAPRSALWGLSKRILGARKTSTQD